MFERCDNLTSSHDWGFKFACCLSWQWGRTSVFYSNSNISIDIWPFASGLRLYLSEVVLNNPAKGNLHGANRKFPMAKTRNRVYREPACSISSPYRYRAWINSRFWQPETQYHSSLSSGEEASRICIKFYMVKTNISLCVSFRCIRNTPKHDFEMHRKCVWHDTMRSTWISYHPLWWYLKIPENQPWLYLNIAFHTLIRMELGWISDIMGLLTP